MLLPPHQGGAFDCRDGRPSLKGLASRRKGRPYGAERNTSGAGGDGRFVKRPYNRKGDAPVGAIHESPALEGYASPQGGAFDRAARI